jgi:hypothetical protein
MMQNDVRKEWNCVNIRKEQSFAIRRNIRENRMYSASGEIFVRTECGLHPGRYQWKKK